MDLLDYLKGSYPTAIEGRYGFAAKESAAETLKEIAIIRGCYKKGQELDYGKAASILMDDFRSGRLGRMTLEEPEN